MEKKNYLPYELEGKLDTLLNGLPLKIKGATYDSKTKKLWFLLNFELTRVPTSPFIENIEEGDAEILLTVFNRYILIP